MKEFDRQTMQSRIEEKTIHETSSILIRHSLISENESPYRRTNFIIRPSIDIPFHKTNLREHEESQIRTDNQSYISTGQIDQKERSIETLGSTPM